MFSVTAVAVIFFSLSAHIKTVLYTYAFQLVTVTQYNTHMIGASLSEPHMYEKYSERVYIYTVWPEILAGNLVWRIGGFESHLPIFNPPKTSQCDVIIIAKS